MDTPAEGEVAAAGRAELRDQLISAKNAREESNKAVHALIAEFNALRETRDQINSEVAALKEERNSRSDEAKELLGKVNDLKASLSALQQVKASPEELLSLIHELDFTYQTRPMPFQDERKMVKRLEELKTLLRMRKFFESKQSEIIALSGRITSLFSASSDIHHKLVAKAAEGAQLHATLVSKSQEIEALKAKSNKAHADVARLSDELRAALSEETGRREEANVDGLIKQDALLQEKAKKLKEELKGKKTFNLRDLQVLGAAGEEMDFEDDKKVRPES